MAPKALLRDTYGALLAAVSHFMNMLAQRSSVAGTGLSVHADFWTCIASAGTLLKKSSTVPVCAVPPRFVIPSGFVRAIAGRIDRSDQTLPPASASATAV